MKKKPFDHRSWHRVISSEQHVHILSEGVLVDFLAGEVTKPLTVWSCGQQVTVLDSQFRWIYFAPTGGHHALTVQLDAQDIPVQFYIDINQANAVQEDGIPYGLDLYLDVVALPEGWKVKSSEIIDADELEAALFEGKVSEEQATFARNEAQKLLQLLLEQNLQDVWLVQQHVISHPRKITAP